jgi:hypothetical protein
MTNNQKYELRLYDTPLLSFEFGESGGVLGGLKIKKITLLNEQAELFPLDLTKTENGMMSWLEKRAIPKNRYFVEEILSSLGLNLNDPKGIIDICKGLSLNDSYWIVPDDFDGKFSQYNLYENRFSEILSLVAYTGVGASDPAFSTSPELTTDGMLPKAWRFIEATDNSSGGIYLYKGGSSGASNTGNEPYSEFYASQIAQVMGINAVIYDLEKWKGILASTCKLFTDIDTSYIPIGRIVREGGIEAVIEHYYNLGEDFKTSINDTLVFDALIYNCDRHFGNFGVLRNNKTGRIIAPAPIFDNGISLFNYATEERFNDIDKFIAEFIFPPYSMFSFEHIFEKVVTPRQRDMLRKIINFKFKRHELYNLPEWRLDAIEKQLQKRVTQLLTLAKDKKYALSDGFGEKPEKSKK